MYKRTYFQSGHVIPCVCQCWLQGRGERAQQWLVKPAVMMSPIVSHVSANVSALYSPLQDPLADTGELDHVARPEEVENSQVYPSFLYS